MLKNTLLLLSLSLLFTACAERGYKISVNDRTNTVIAQKSVDIRTDKSTTTKANIKEMDNAVKKEQKKKHSKITNSKVKEKNSQKIIEEKKLAKEKEKKKLLAKKEEKEKVALEQKLEKEKKAQQQKSKKEKALLAQKEKEEKEALERKLEKERKAQVFSKKEEKALLKLKEKEKKKALDQKLAREKELRLLIEKEKKALLALKEQEERKALNQKLTREAKAREAKAFKEKKARDAKTLKEKENKATIENKQVVASTEPIIFQPINKTYHKFGTSEIHGHVVYLDPTGQEITLTQSKVYLLPKSTKIDYWYNHYYLKNKSNSSLNKTVAQYLNATTLNLNKNFEFFGVAAGEYYVIIESKYPSRMAKNKKVYIAKKIKVDKYKKVMAVFSKKL